MEILIVEDDQYKRDAVQELLKSKYEDATLRTCTSVQTAIIQVNKQDFDEVILDMSLPSHEPKSGGALGIPLLSGGLEVLFELLYLEKSPKVVVLTQYPEIEMSNQLVPISDVKDFVNTHYGFDIDSCIYFDVEDSDWKQKFIEGV